MEKGSQRLPVSDLWVFLLELWSDLEVLHNRVNDFDFDFYFDSDSSFGYCCCHMEENDSPPDPDHYTVPLLLRGDVWVHLVAGREDSHI